MKTAEADFRTKKGARVFRRSRTVDGKKIYGEDFMLRAKQRHVGGAKEGLFNLGTTKKEAGELADKILAFLAVDGNTIDEALIRYSRKHRHKALLAQNAPLQKEELLTVGSMIEAFLSVTHHLSTVTQRNNTQALRHLAAGILGLPKLGKNQTKEQQQKWRKKVEAFPLVSFTNAEIERFRQREMALAKGDHLKAGATATTLNSYLRAARGVFSKKLLPLYENLKLPDPIPFRGLAPLPEPSHRYRSEIDAADLVDRAKAALYPTHKPGWIAFILCIGAGLRREEVDKLEWSQVDLDERRIWIRTTEFFRPKAKNSEAYIDISEGVASYLKEYRDSQLLENPSSRFVLPGKEIGGKLRAQPVLKVLMTWLRAENVPARTPLHTLRKEAGSLIFQKAGSIDRAAEFLRNDPRVAREHYVGRKERIELEIQGL